jgi:serine/threonine protein kinase
MSLDKPLDLEYIGKGTYGIIMKKFSKNDVYVIKQFRIEIYDNGINSLEKEVNLTKLAYNINHNIFINIFKEEQSEINLAKQININVPFINSISINNYGYIHMEYMNSGDLYNFIKNNKKCNLSGVLGCYFNALNILHNEIKIVHGDLTPNNLLIHYIGENYRQRIIINNENYFINTNGYSYKICDFGLAEHLENTTNTKCYYNHIYRDYLLLFFIYFHKKKFDNYNKFAELIEIPIERINDELYNNYRTTDKYYNGFVKEYNYNSVCNFFNEYLEIHLNNKLIFEFPKLLLEDFIDIIFSFNIIEDYNNILKPVA